MWTLKLILESEKASIFSPRESTCEISEFEKFLSIKPSLTDSQLLQDFDSIISALNKMLKDCGARENLFRLEGGRIKAIPLFTSIGRKKGVGTLRLYCIRYSERLLIVGNGGIKKVKKYEENSALKSIVDTLRQIDSKVFSKARKKKISFDNYKEFKNLLETIIIK